MKIILFVFFVSFSSLSFGAPCEGASGKAHTNPDGSAGGFVASTAQVARSVVLDSSSTVCEQAKVQGNVKIKSGSIISGGASIEGNTEITSSRVYGSAKVYGKAQVVNSAVCQASDINFKVSSSDYYCQTDDPEPKHPGEAGEKTILGIDSDADGVRDDVEIWINNQTTNTPNKNFYNLRMALKQIARDLQQNVKSKDNRAESIEVFKRARDSFFCFRDIATNNEYEELSGALQVEVYNTMDRLKVWAKLQGNINGQSFKIEDRKKLVSCQFRVKGP